MNLAKMLFTFNRKELPLVISMFAYFFFVITTFWILKPLKKTLFIRYYDKTGFDFFNFHFNASQTELLAKVGNLFVAILALWAFSWLSKRFQREKLTYAFSSFFLISFSLLSFFFEQVNSLLVWSFYLYGDLFIILMVPAFFAFLNDSVTPEESKRLYGPIVLGGVLGGVFGTNWVRLWLKEIEIGQWMWICVAITLGIVLAAHMAGRYIKKNKQHHISSSIDESSGSLLNYIQTAIKNPYILLLIALIGLYEMTSQIMDFQFSSVVSYYLDGDEIGKHFSTVYAAVTWVSLFVQLFLTSFVLTRFGVRTGLTVLPGAILIATLGFVFAPILWLASLLPIFDNGLNYSINQSSRELLYVPLKPREKYQAKALIDIFGMRVAKVLAIGLSFIVSMMFSEFETFKWLSLCIAIIVTVWLFVIVKVGKEYRKKCASNENSNVLVSGFNRKEEKNDNIPLDELSFIAAKRKISNDKADTNHHLN